MKSNEAVSRQQNDDAARTRRIRVPAWRLAAGLAVLAVLLATYLVLWRSGMLDRLFEAGALEQAVGQLGPAGPVLIIGLMTAAIVMSPIPSAPIALAAGAAYGHFWGTVYVAAGSEAGALIAFGIARLIGYDALKPWLGAPASSGILHRFIASQNALMAVVFVTRMMPFLSFDFISYAAGLTPLKTWRFAVATLLGIIPASFMLAHFGDELASGDLRRIGLTVLLLGSITLLPFLWKAAPARYRSALRRLLRLG
ncbi:MAG: TVP38/TMEM64 family protein [Kiloniellaceae bacterium]